MSNKDALSLPENVKWVISPLDEEEKPPRVVCISDTMHYVHNPDARLGTRCVGAICTEAQDAARGFITVREMLTLQLRQTRYAKEGGMYTWHWADECPRERTGGTEGEP